MPKPITKRLIIWAIVVLLVLMIPLVAMQISDQWHWHLSDFIFMGVLLYGACLAYEFIARKMPTTSYRLGVGVAVLTGLALVWINVAVGIIGDGPINLLYCGVLAVGCIGALIAWFMPKGMMRALIATAIAQAVVALVALIFEFSAAPGPLGILFLNCVFIALWIVSALLFRYSSLTVLK